MAGKEGKEIVVTIISIHLCCYVPGYIVLYHIALGINPDIETDLLREALRKPYAHP